MQGATTTSTTLVYNDVAIGHLDRIHNPSVGTPAKQVCRVYTALDFEFRVYNLILGLVMIVKPYTSTYT